MKKREEKGKKEAKGFKYFPFRGSLVLKIARQERSPVYIPSLGFYPPALSRYLTSFLFSLLSGKAALTRLIQKDKGRFDSRWPDRKLNQVQTLQ